MNDERAADPIADRHAQGQFTAAERLELLLDEASFAGEAIDGLVGGAGQVNGRRVFVYARDIMAAHGALTLAQAEAIARLQDQACASGAPLIGLFDSRGLAADSGLAGLAACGRLLRNAAQARRTSVQLALVMGPCIGVEALLAATSDFLFMTRDHAALFMTGPDIVAALTGDRLSAAELGGARTHAEASGLAAGAYDTEVDLLRDVRRLIDLLPPGRGEPAPTVSHCDDAGRAEASLDSLVPDDPAQAYDVKELIVKIVDEGEFFELAEAHAASIVVGFARVDGSTVGLIAHQPQVQAGALDCAALRKATRFVRFCALFDVPVVSLVDTPGFLPGATEEQGGIASEAAAFFCALAEVNAAKIAIILRQTLGAAALAMGLKPAGADLVYAWPSAGLALKRGQADLDGALARGLIDAVILPHETRSLIAAALRLTKAR